MLKYFKVNLRYLIAAVFTIAKKWKQPKCPSTDEWIKMWCTHIHNEILFSHKKEGNLPFVTTWMDLEGVMLSEISQTEKDEYCVISLVRGI